MPTSHRLITPLHGYSFGLIVAGLLCTSLPAATLQKPVLVGEVARGLSGEDLRQIEQVVGARGGRVWLLIGVRGMVPSVRSVDAYLASATVTLDVRRGSVLTLVHATPAARAVLELPPPADQSGWVVARAGDFAQVAVSGRPFDRVAGDDDINRPFKVLGSFGDAELSALVAFVRNSPARSPSASDGQARIRGDLPVLSVGRRGGLVEVRSRISAAEHQRVLLRAQSSRWQVVSVDTVFR